MTRVRCHVCVVCVCDATCALPRVRLPHVRCHVCEPHREDVAARVLQRKREVPVEADLCLQGSPPMVQHDHSRPLAFAAAPTSPSGTTALAGTAKWDQTEDCRRTDLGVRAVLAPEQRRDVRQRCADFPPETRETASAVVRVLPRLSARGFTAVLQHAVRRCNMLRGVATCCAALPAQVLRGLAEDPLCPVVPARPTLRRPTAHALRSSGARVDGTTAAQTPAPLAPWRGSPGADVALFPSWLGPVRSQRWSGRGE